MGNSVNTVSLSELLPAHLKKNNSGDAEGGDAKPEDTSEAANRKPDDTPVTGNAASNGNQTSQQQARSLGDEDREASKEIKPDRDPFAEAQKATDMARARYGLTEEQAQHLKNGITGFAMAGINIDQSLVDAQVKNVAPINFELTKFKELVGASMANVSLAMNLPTPLSNLTQQQAPSPVLPA